MENALAVLTEVKDVQAIRPFRINIQLADLDDLQHRIPDTRWPEKGTVADNSQRIRLATMQTLADHWTTSYDGRNLEARINTWRSKHIPGRTLSGAAELGRAGVSEPYLL